ncbi:MAG: heavy-metal-associated domain-containing protein [Saprospiraceae bacterium]|nr:heavy-metal-associated domain-containing protein [Saprospiraceae bacterium]
MKEFTFKTNINCVSCVRSVTSFLEEVPGIESWVVDTTDPEKKLTVEGNTVESQQIITAVQEAGFNIEPIIKS